MRQTCLCFMLLGTLGPTSSCAQGRLNVGLRRENATADPSRLTLDRIFDPNDFKLKSIERVR